MDGTALSRVGEAELRQVVKCAAFGASSLADQQAAVGDFGGQLQLVDVERLTVPVFRVQAHDGLLNALDARGGQVHAGASTAQPPVLPSRMSPCAVMLMLLPPSLQSTGHGAPEIATCGRDGAVRVWDPRQPDAAVASFPPAGGSSASDCWCVAMGNAFDDQERCVLAGYANGDLRMFDLRTGTVRWEANVAAGVCCVQVGGGASGVCAW